MKYQLKLMGKEYTDAGFAYLDVNKVARIPKEVGIRNMPTFIYYKGGEKVEEFEGGMDVKKLTTQVKETLIRNLD